MVLPDNRNSAGGVLDEQTAEAPLLSDEGKKFLDGEIDAEEYVADARRLAVARARLELALYLAQQRRRRLRVTAFTFLILTSVAYLILGIATVLGAARSSDSAFVSIVAFSTAGVTVVVTILYALSAVSRDIVDRGITTILKFMHIRDLGHPEA